MKKDTLVKATDIQKRIATQMQRISELDKVIKDRNENPDRLITLESNYAKVYIHDSRIIDIFISILQADFQDKLKKAEKEFADLKD